MRIVVDVSPLSRPRSGVGQYLLGMTGGLAVALGEGDSLCALAVASDRGAARIRDALTGLPVELILRRVRAPHQIRTAWSMLGRPQVERLTGGFDVFHPSDWMQPAQRAGIRATTVCDLVPLRFPEWTTPRTRRMLSRKLADARVCDLVFAISEYTAGDVVGRLSVPAARVRVARPGVDPRYRPEGHAEERRAPYLLLVGTLEPRKNLGAALEAFALLRRSRSDLELLVAGPPGWGEVPDLERPGVHRLGYVDERRLAGLYRGASALVYSSWFEGFGMPVVEAMASGLPAVVSSHPSLDEAAGTAALRADPGSAEELAEAVEKALADPGRLRRAGLAHAASFTWEACGRAVMAGYRSAL